MVLFTYQEFAYELGYILKYLKYLTGQKIATICLCAIAPGSRRVSYL
jgi:hypothetical protein